MIARALLAVYGVVLLVLVVSITRSALHAWRLCRARRYSRRLMNEAYDEHRRARA